MHSNEAPRMWLASRKTLIKAVLSNSKVITYSCILSEHDPSTLMYISAVGNGIHWLGD